MKNLFCLLIAVTSWGVITAMTKEDAKSALKPFGEACDNEPSDNDLDAILDNLEDCPESAKCFRLCLVKQMEMWTDCKLDPQKVSDMVGMVIDGKEEETVEIVNGCNAKVTCGDECEAIHNLSMCVLKDFKTRNWPMPEFDES